MTKVELQNLIDILPEEFDIVVSDNNDNYSDSKIYINHMEGYPAEFTIQLPEMLEIEQIDRMYR